MAENLGFSQTRKGLQHYFNKGDLVAASMPSSNSTTIGRLEELGSDYLVFSEVLRAAATERGVEHRFVAGPFCLARDVAVEVERVDSSVLENFMRERHPYLEFHGHTMLVRTSGGDFFGQLSREYSDRIHLMPYLARHMIEREGEEPFYAEAENPLIVAKNDIKLVTPLRESLDDLIGLHNKREADKGKSPEPGSS